MKIIPLSRWNHQIFPLDETAIEITEAEYQCLQDGSKCFNESLTAVIEYVPTEEELAVKTEQHKQTLRLRRERECFPIINRGQLWYERLTVEQRTELNTWYQSWLDVTTTKVEPAVPEWLLEV